MPPVAVVEGLAIQFYPKEHPPPHFHAEFAEFMAQIRIEPVEILQGPLLPNKVGSVLSWVAEHRDALMPARTTMEAGRKPGKIA